MTGLSVNQLLVLIILKYYYPYLSFAVVGPSSWNNLPSNLCMNCSVSLSASFLQAIEDQNLFEHGFTVLSRECL